MVLSPIYFSARVVLLLLLKRLLLFSLVLANAKNRVCRKAGSSWIMIIFCSIFLYLSYRIFSLSERVERTIAAAVGIPEI